MHTRSRRKCRVTCCTLSMSSVNANIIGRRMIVNLALEPGVHDFPWSFNIGF
ncbi:hypothetical protein PF010_g10336 [Phytophthora fragariae]|uniref:Uncharacterized protein n=2 Tax=Phytophthora TaxID=4783 RepID=A0A6A3LV47_9STRA|nr:hypothetical protein PF011_g4152 [Phytophthora fragariae]KAE9036402.1 hypothetical protein PR002_g7107 [Phytophthora rubi]KAE9038524.1 hypothetical protein PR001_g7917 [Phytophthora rubi]KAE9112735.1 hypothetical protein PF010_g10336 [Phytophthora fragariae]KAE9347006.1 hypothetical protein PR003_g7145 [Phytophthora rubi]